MPVRPQQNDFYLSSKVDSPYGKIVPRGATGSEVREE